MRHHQPIFTQKFPPIGIPCKLLGNLVFQIGWGISNLVRLYRTRVPQNPKFAFLFSWNAKSSYHYNHRLSNCIFYFLPLVEYSLDSELYSCHSIESPLYVWGFYSLDSSLHPCHLVVSTLHLRIAFPRFWVIFPLSSRVHVIYPRVIFLCF